MSDEKIIIIHGKLIDVPVRMVDGVPVVAMDVSPHYSKTRPFLTPAVRKVIEKADGDE